MTPVKLLFTIYYPACEEDKITVTLSKTVVIYYLY